MSNELKVVMLDTQSVKPYHRNARKNDETVLKLCEIIKKVGFNQPIVVDKNNVIVKGHSRWKAAVRLGLEKIPCIISENDDETNKLDRLADNKIQEFSKWDNEKLVTELSSLNLSFDDIDITDFGFDFDFPDTRSTPAYTPPVAEGGYPEYDTSDTPDSVPTYTPPAYTPPAPDENFITEQDVQRTLPSMKTEYGAVTCPRCGTEVLYKIKK